MNNTETPGAPPAPHFQLTPEALVRAGGEFNAAGLNRVGRPDGQFLRMNPSPPDSIRGERDMKSAFAVAAHAQLVAAVAAVSSAARTRRDYPITITGDVTVQKDVKDGHILSVSVPYTIAITSDVMQREGRPPLIEQDHFTKTVGRDNATTMISTIIQGMAYDYQQSQLSSLFVPLKIDVYAHDKSDGTYYEMVVQFVDAKCAQEMRYNANGKPIDPTASASQQALRVFAERITTSGIATATAAPEDKQDKQIEELRRKAEENERRLAESLAAQEKLSQQLSAILGRLPESKPEPKPDDKLKKA